MRAYESQNAPVLVLYIVLRIVAPVKATFNSTCTRSPTTTWDTDRLHDTALHYSTLSFALDNTSDSDSDSDWFTSLSLGQQAVE